MKVFLIAGEPSGDALGGALMAGLINVAPTVAFSGVGGSAMQAQGLNSLFPMDELSVMGVAEVLPKYFHLKRRIAQTAEAVLQAQPDVLITIDSPDFCLRVAKLVKAQSQIRVVHYVAPTVWAWRPKRAEKMARVVDHVLALFPFEPPYMQAAGMACDFVGHPAAGIPIVSRGETSEFRERHGLQDAQPLMLLLPGSRKGEVGRLGPRMAEAVGAIARENPDMRFVLPAAGPVAPLVREMTASWPVTPVVLDPTGQRNETAEREKRAAFAAADFALAASGTVALELAAARTPMVSFYDFNWLSRIIIQRMLQTDTGNLINLVTDTRTVPEFLGAQATPENLVRGMSELMAAPEAQRAAMDQTMTALGRGGENPGLRAAKAVLARLG